VSRLRVHCFSISLDGYSAGPGQDLGNPVGVGGLAVFGWQFATRAHHQMRGTEGGATGLDHDMVMRGFDGIGAWIIGRNMFGPVRGPWPDETWKGWWGDTPPYHVPVFVLTHHARAPISMSGGTTFHFVAGVHSAAQRASAAANGKDIRVGGGVSTIQQFLQANLIDELHLAISPTLLGSGEHPRLPPHPTHPHPQSHPRSPHQKLLNLQRKAWHPTAHKPAPGVCNLD
jgi:dihydrofolate reductase